MHFGRGGDEEGAAALFEAATWATEAGDELLAARAHRDLAFADLQRGRYEAARAAAQLAARLASGNDEELAWIGAIDGACLTDLGHYDAAAAALTEARSRADHVGAVRPASFAASFLGRLRLLRDELEEARLQLLAAVSRTHAHWRAFEPFPAALLAEVELRLGDVDAAFDRFERAFVMGHQLDDACIESIATRGLGLVARARDDPTRAYGLLVEAPRRSRRLPDSYRWIEAYGLDALCSVAVEQAVPAAPRWVAELEVLASRCGMRELLARAMLHRCTLGEPAAGDVACDLARSIDNPRLQAELTPVAA